MRVRTVVLGALLSGGLLTAACGNLSLADQDISCLEPLTFCGGDCVDVAADPNNCGGCDRRCGVDSVCFEKTCQLSCLAGTVACDRACVDVMADVKHCGACRNACGAGEVCSGGNCSIACLGGSVKCGAQCVDVHNDPSHCGECDNGCGLGKVCVNGLCSIGCGGGTTQCGNKCVNTDNDATHCGGCGLPCQTGEVCTGGNCSLSCPPGTTKCGSSCIDTANNPLHCGSCFNGCAGDELCSGGSCGLFCGSGTIECNDKCVDVQHDPQNCGTCGNGCGVGFDCVAGSCVYACGTDSLLCGSECVSPLTDPNHCGGCGKRCLTGEVCTNGTCGIDCGALTNCFDTCVDTTSDTLHCGQCGKSCATTEACENGVCTCPSDQMECLGKCVEVASDPLNCGTCGVGCGFNEVCSEGTCVCRSGTESCGGTCFDTGISSANCGECGVGCPVGNVCTKGLCELPISHWNTFGQSIAHTGENAAETGAPPLALAWTVKIINAGAMHPVVVDAGRAFATYTTYFSEYAPVLALNASDGTQLWDYNFGKVYSVGHPAAFAGSVYVATGKPSGGVAYVWKLQGATGTVTWTAAISAQWEKYWAPILVDGTVFANGGTYGGLYGLHNSDGSQKFFKSLEQYDQWSPAYANDAVYTFIAGKFRRHNPSTGDALWTVETGWSWSGYAMRTAPVIYEGHAYVIAPPNLHAINLTSQAIEWTANGTFAGTPAVADGVVYALSARHLVARDATTGALVGTFPGDGQLKYPPVIASGHVFVASDANVYAVEISTMTSAWSAPSGGWLSIAAKRLFIARTDGRIEAYVFEN